MAAGSLTPLSRAFRAVVMLKYAPPDSPIRKTGFPGCSSRTAHISSKTRIQPLRAELQALWQEGFPGFVLQNRSRHKLPNRFLHHLDNLAGSNSVFVEAVHADVVFLTLD